MESKSDSELRYRIRANTHLISERSEMLHELSEQIKACLDKPSDPDRYKKIGEILEVWTQLTRKNILLIDEMQEEIAKARRKD